MATKKIKITESRYIIEFVGSAKEKVLKKDLQGETRSTVIDIDENTTILQYYENTYLKNLKKQKTYMKDGVKYSMNFSETQKDISEDYLTVAIYFSDDTYENYEAYEVTIALDGTDNLPSKEGSEYLAVPNADKVPIKKADSSLNSTQSFTVTTSRYLVSFKGNNRIKKSSTQSEDSEYTETVTVDAEVTIRDYYSSLLTSLKKKYNAVKENKLEYLSDYEIDASVSVNDMDYSDYEIIKYKIVNDTQKKLEEEYEAKTGKKLSSVIETIITSDDLKKKKN